MPTGSRQRIGVDDRRGGGLRELPRRNMAAEGVSAAGVGDARRIAPADLLRESAARMEVTAPRRVDGRRNIPLEHDARALARGIGHRNRAEERVRVGMQRPFEEIVRTCGLHDFQKKCATTVRQRRLGL